MPTGAEMLVAVNDGETPAGVIRPIELFALFVYQSAPSGPAVMAAGCEVVGAADVGTGSPGGISPAGFALVNHNAPSGPAAMASGSTMPASEKTVPAREVVIRPIESFPPIAELALFVNHNAPSEPVAIP